jgi:hypothetical protein
VSGSLSRRHSAPKPNLKDDTDHFAREEMSGHFRLGGVSVPIHTSNTKNIQIWTRGKVPGCINGVPSSIVLGGPPGATLADMRLWLVNKGHHDIVTAFDPDLTLITYNHGHPTVNFGLVIMLPLEDYLRYGRQMILDGFGLPG